MIFGLLNTVFVPHPLFVMPENQAQSSGPSNTEAIHLMSVIVLVAAGATPRFISAYNRQDTKIIIFHLSLDELRVSISILRTKKEIVKEMLEKTHAWL